MASKPTYEYSSVLALMRLAIVGDTMLGRGVAEALTAGAPASLVEPELAAMLRDAHRVPPPGTPAGRM